MTITLRLEKGEELTWEELDGNFQELVAAINERVQSITINGGEPTLPNSEGLVDLLVESDNIEKVTTTKGDSYVLRGHSNIVTGEGSVILGRNSEDNGSLSFITGLNNKILTTQEYNSIIGGMDAIISAAVQKHAIILGGLGNQILGDTGGATLSGYKNKVSGGYAVAIGGASSVITANAWGSVLAGSYSTLGSPYSFLSGFNITLNAGNQNRGINFAGGTNHVITAIGATVFGTGHSVVGNWATVVGQAALPVDNVTTGNNANDLRFVVGNGTISLSSWAATTRSNALEVYHDGRVVAPSLSTTLIDANTDGKVLITKEYFEANSGGGELPENIVESISLNGGTPVLPVDGNVDLTIESGGGEVFRKVTTPYGDSYILKYYDVDNYVTSEGNIIMGKNNNLGNGYENLLFTKNTTLTNNAWHNLIHGVGHTLNGAVRYAVFGEYNTISDGAQDGIAVGNNIQNQIQLSALFGTQLTNNFTNSNWIGDTNFMQGRKNTLRGGRYTSVFGEFHDIGNGVTPVNGAMIIGSASDYSSLPSQPSFLIGGGDINYSGHTLVSRANNFAVMKTGEVLAFQSDNTKIDAASGKVLLTKEYVEANYIKKPTQVFEDNASALAGGLSVDDTYRTADGTIKIVF